MIKRKSDSMFPEFPHQWEEKRSIGFLCLAPSLRQRRLSHNNGITVPTHHAGTRTVSSSSLVTLQRKESPPQNRDLHPLCPSAQCSHLLPSLVSLGDTKHVGASFFCSRGLKETLGGSSYLLSFVGQHLSHLSPLLSSCATSGNLKISCDFDPIMSSRNWFDSPVDLPVKFFRTFPNASCSNLNPFFLFLSLLTNVSGFFSFWKLPRCA